MANVRLRVNTISGGKFIPVALFSMRRWSPSVFEPRTTSTVTRRTGNGLVLLLRDLSFQSLARPMSDGVATSFPTHVARGELFDLSQVPASKRQALVEGEDYKTDWTFEEAEALRKVQEDVYANAKQFETETGSANRVQKQMR